MSRARSLVLLAAAALVVACDRQPKDAPSRLGTGSSAPAAPSASAPPAPPELAKGDVVTLMESLALLHAEHMKDCGRLTTALEAFEASRAGELVRAAPASYAAIEADPGLSERLGRAMEMIMTVSMACANEPRFAALHARRQGKPVPVVPSASAPVNATPPAVPSARLTR